MRKRRLRPDEKRNINKPTNKTIMKSFRVYERCSRPARSLKGKVDV